MRTGVETTVCFAWVERNYSVCLCVGFILICLHGTFCVHFQVIVIKTRENKLHLSVQNATKHRKREPCVKQVYKTMQNQGRSPKKITDHNLHIEHGVPQLVVTLHPCDFLKYISPSLHMLQAVPIICYLSTPP